jgi:hypothetical protein
MAIIMLGSSYGTRTMIALQRNRTRYFHKPIAQDVLLSLFIMEVKELLLERLEMQAASVFPSNLRRIFFV